MTNEVLQSFVNSKGYHRIVLFEEAEGVYIFVYEDASISHPQQDHLQDTWAIAKTQCLEDFGVPLDSWQPINERPSL